MIVSEAFKFLLLVEVNSIIEIESSANEIAVEDVKAQCD